MAHDNDNGLRSRTVGLEPVRHSKRDKIGRLRTRIAGLACREPSARNTLDIIKGVLDLLDDEL